MNYEVYNTKLHQLFQSAFTIRSNSESTVDELHKANNYIDKALSITIEFEKNLTDKILKQELINDRLRCYIERIAIYTRILKTTYNTQLFNKISSQHEHYCKLYKNLIINELNNEIEQSLNQLKIITRQSLAANYFYKSKKGENKELCLKALSYINDAINLTQDSNTTEVLNSNKLQISNALEKI